MSRHLKWCESPENRFRDLGKFKLLNLRNYLIDRARIRCKRKKMTHEKLLFTFEKLLVAHEKLRCAPVHFTVWYSKHYIYVKITGMNRKNYGVLQFTIRHYRPKTTHRYIASIKELWYWIWPKSIDAFKFFQILNFLRIFFKIV